MPTVSELYAARAAARAAKAEADSRAEVARAALARAEADAEAAGRGASDAERALADGMPDGVVYVVEPTLALVKIAGELHEYPTADPTRPAPIAAG